MNNDVRITLNYWTAKDLTKWLEIFLKTKILPQNYDSKAPTYLAQSITPAFEQLLTQLNNSR